MPYIDTNQFTRYQKQHLSTNRQNILCLRFETNSTRFLKGHISKLHKNRSKEGVKNHFIDIKILMIELSQVNHNHKFSHLYTRNIL